MATRKQSPQLPLLASLARSRSQAPLLADRLSPLGLSLKKVPGDGNCQFHAVHASMVAKGLECDPPGKLRIGETEIGEIGQRIQGTLVAIGMKSSPYRNNKVNLIQGDWNLHLILGSGRVEGDFVTSSRVKKQYVTYYGQERGGGSHLPQLRRL